MGGRDRVRARVRVRVRVRVRARIRVRVRVRVRVGATIRRPARIGRRETRPRGRPLVVCGGTTAEARDETLGGAQSGSHCSGRRTSLPKKVSACASDGAGHGGRPGA